MGGALIEEEKELNMRYSDDKPIEYPGSTPHTLKPWRAIWDL
jgi:hypothetical protein